MIKTLHEVFRQLWTEPLAAAFAQQKRDATIDREARAWFDAPVHVNAFTGEILVSPSSLAKFELREEGAA